MQQNTLPTQSQADPAGCPYHTSRQKTAPSDSNHAAPDVERAADGTWHVRSFAAARAVLRSSDVRQAGFQAEMMGDVMQMMREPMLFLEGPEHLALRKQTARFFTPKAVRTYGGMIERYVDAMLADLQRAGRLDLSDMSMKLAVRVAAEVVGLTNSDFDGMAKRLSVFFEMDPFDPKEPWSFTKVKKLVHSQAATLNFYLRDVRPAIRARREQPQEDLISHLIAQAYKNMELMTECVTFGAAGMVTTREFIVAAAWHFLQNDALRADYLAAEEDARFELLHEILRLEPVVGNLLRRTTAPIELESSDGSVTIPAGELVNVHIYAANEDETVLGTPTDVVCPHRDLPRGVQPYGMSFGDGAHRCPGAYIAIEETDVFLTRFLRLENLRIEQEPTVTWNEVVKGYEIRNLIVAVD